MVKNTSQKVGKFELNKTYLGDCMELTKGLPDNSIDLVVTSPPYSNILSYGKQVSVYGPQEYIDWFLPLFHEAGRFLKDSGSFILNINDKVSKGERSTYVFELVTRIVTETKLKLFDRYIWFKKQTLPTTGSRRLNDRIEYIFHFVKDVKKFKCYIDRVREPYKESSLRRFRRKMHGTDIIDETGETTLSDRGEVKPHPLGTKPITIFKFDTGSATRGIKHPAPFHYNLPKWFIIWLTDKGDIILDPFMGSGSTAIACVKMKRNYIGFEINPTYITMANERVDSIFK